MKYTLANPEKEEVLLVLDSLGNPLSARVSGGMIEVTDSKTGARRVFPMTGISSTGVFKVATALGNIKLQISRGGPLEGSAAKKLSKNSLKSSMPGKVLKLLCKVGDKVSEGTPLLIIEAMKMENEIRAAHASIVKTIKVQPGDKVDSGTLLLEFED